MSSIGIKLPIKYSDGDGFTMLITIRQMIKQNLKMLILTDPGERVMEPDFGAGIRQLLFSNYSEGVQGKIEKRIRTQVAIYIPVVTINKIKFKPNADGNSLSVQITYQIPDIGINDLLQFTI